MVISSTIRRLLDETWLAMNHWRCGVRRFQNGSWNNPWIVYEQSMEVDWVAVPTEPQISINDMAIMVFDGGTTQINHA